MANSVGKIFENNFKSSVPKDVFCYRPPDSAQGFNIPTSSLRFSSKSICDFMIFRSPMLYCLELKTVEKSSISFERNKEDRGVIHKYQTDKLIELSKYENIIAGLVLDFRTSENTYFLDIRQWNILITNIDKKSFNEQDLLKYTSPFLIQKRKLKVNYRYDVESLLNDLENMQNEINIIGKETSKENLDNE